jgi:hypothetical protein
MNNPEVLLIPCMMFADYYLTVFAAVQREKKYSEHFKTEHYELNPLWQKVIAEKKWFNLRHTLLAILFSSALLYLTEFSIQTPYMVQGLIGCLFVVYGMIIGRHVSNIMIFRYMAKHRGDISGQISMSHAMVLSISVYQYLVVVIPFALVALFAPTPHVVGGLLGAVMVLVIHVLWIIKHKGQIKASENSESGSNGDSQES